MEEILIVEIDYNLNEFITNDGNTYPILFDIDENTSISDLQNSLNEAKDIFINLLK